MAPETPLAAIGVATAVDATISVSWMGIVWADGFAAIWKVAVATVPSGMVVVFSPMTRHKFPCNPGTFEN